MLVSKALCFGSAHPGASRWPLINTSPHHPPLYFQSSSLQPQFLKALFCPNAAPNILLPYRASTPLLLLKVQPSFEQVGGRTPASSLWPAVLSLNRQDSTIQNLGPFQLPKINLQETSQWKTAKTAPLKCPRPAALPQEKQSGAKFESSAFMQIVTSVKCRLTHGSQRLAEGTPRKESLLPPMLPRSPATQNPTDLLPFSLLSLNRRKRLPLPSVHGPHSTICCLPVR